MFGRGKGRVSMYTGQTSCERWSVFKLRENSVPLKAGTAGTYRKYCVPAPSSSGNREMGT